MTMAQRMAFGLAVLLVAPLPGIMAALVGWAACWLWEATARPELWFDHSWAYIAAAAYFYGRWLFGMPAAFDRTMRRWAAEAEQ